MANGHWLCGAVLVALAAAAGGQAAASREEDCRGGRGGGRGGRCPAARSSAAALGPSLLQLDHRRSLSQGDDFEPVSDGTNRACRGRNSFDTSHSYYTLFPRGRNLEACMAKCRETAGCVGVEHGPNGRCEVWTRSEGIGAAVARSGFTCLRYAPFQPVDGGVDRACRGANARDNANSYFEVHFRVTALSGCQARCLTHAGCVGIEYSSASKRCEVWTRPQGIRATARRAGFACQRLAPPAPAPAPAAPAPAPATREGCACLASWLQSGFPNSPCHNYCCNPDTDPNGPWCFVQDSACQGQNWGYCAAAPPPAPSTTTFWPGPISVAERAQPAEWAHFRLVDQLRQAGHTCPLGRRYLPNPIPLKFDCRLYAAARKHSQDMADLNYFSHDSLSGRSFMDRCLAEGISANAENIAARCEDEDCAFRQFINSDPHCNNIMNPGMKLFAVSRAYNGASMYKFYWTELLSAEDAVPDTSCYQQAS